MKLFKNSLFTLLCFCCMLFVFSCTEEQDLAPQDIQTEFPSDIEGPMDEVPVSQTTASNRTWICWEMMSEISFGNVPECAAGAAAILENAFNGYVNSPSDYDVYLNMFYHIYLWGVMVNCDPDNCGNCTDYLATANAFAQCLVDNNSPYAGGLDSIIDFLEGHCGDCTPIVTDCCDQIVFYAYPSASADGCCVITVVHELPEGCGELNVLENQWRHPEVTADCDRRVTGGKDTTTYTFCCQDGDANGQQIRFHLQMGDCADYYTGWIDIGGCSL